MIIRQEVDRAEHATLIEPTRDKLLLFLSNPIKRRARNITRNINFLLLSSFGRCRRVFQGHPAEHVLGSPTRETELPPRFFGI